ncbi:hypothetical protein K0A97_03050 [Patescibacteria group bacterium]|nr:hypothetical protein [Patescibacteria group bacterium]
MKRGYQKKNQSKGIFLFLYLIFAAYFLNYPFRFMEVPEFFLSIDQWIIFFGGILLILGAYNHLRKKATF